MSRALAGRVAAAYRFVSTLWLAFSSGSRSRSATMARRARSIPLDDVLGQLDSDDEFMAEGSDDDLDMDPYYTDDDSEEGIVLHLELFKCIQIIINKNYKTEQDEAMCLDPACDPPSPAPDSHTPLSCE